MIAPDIVATPAELEVVRSILRRHVPDREVWVFGSRVKGTSKRYADLDLAVIGNEMLTLATLAALREEFTESDLPYKVDIVDWASTSEAFRSRIAALYAVLCAPQTGSAAVPDSDPAHPEP